jgi:hypothetical protein
VQSKTNNFNTLWCWLLKNSIDQSINIEIAFPLNLKRLPVLEFSCEFMARQTIAFVRVKLQNGLKNLIEIDL